jgi:hypothetical protein
MDNSKYLVNVYWEPKRSTGQQEVNVGGVTQSMPSYTEGYYVASMPEIQISATGSTRTDAFNSLLTLSATASNFGNPALGTHKKY